VEPVDGAELRAERPHVARMYDYYLGGKDNFAVDRPPLVGNESSAPSGALPGHRPAVRR
jgi:hypothetical protein